MKPYPAYKDSGVEWLGQMPEGWEVVRLKHVLAQIGSGGTPDTNESAFWSDSSHGTPWVSIGDMSGVDLVRDTAKRLTDEGIASKKLSVWPRGTLLFSMYASLGHTAVTDLAVAINQAILALMPSNRILQRYLKLWLEFLRPHLKAAASSNTQDNLNAQTVENLHIYLPPLPEQQAIAAFLDRETAKIDGLIEEQRRLIALLAEKRQATISHAVTRGLNPSARLKPSGVDWLGDIPEGWEVVRVKTLAAIISKGTTPTTMGFDFEDSGIRFIKAENITFEGRVEAEPEFYISVEADSALARSRLKARDILVVIAGATTGKSAVLRECLLPANTNQAVAFVRCYDGQDAAWIQRWLSTPSIQNLISLGSVQSAQPNLSMEDLGNLPLLLPPAVERDRILKVCDCHIAQIDALTETAAFAISLLQERRAALISAAVTGKIDVRDLATVQEAA